MRLNISWLRATWQWLTMRHRPLPIQHKKDWRGTRMATPRGEVWSADDSYTLMPNEPDPHPPAPGHG
jgi:hypothetical protein